MSAPWEDFGGAAQPQAVGPWQDFAPAKPQKIGADAFPDFLRAELANTDWGTRNIAGLGTAISGKWEALKQYFGQGDPQQIEANNIIEKAAPVGAITGNVLATAAPFGLAGNTVGAAAKVGTALGALNPVEGQESVWNKKGVEDKLKSMALSGGLSALGQGVANKAGEYVSNKLADLQDLMTKNAPLTKTVNDAMDAGLVVPPSSVNPTWWNQLKESIGGKAATAQTASNRNAPVIDDLARKALYLDANAPLEAATMQGARDAAYQVGYKPVAETANIVADEPLLNSLISLSPASKGGAVKNPAQGQISDLIDSLANKGQWTGDQLVFDIRQLRQQASANFRAAGMPGGNPSAAELAKAQQAASDALEGLAQRNITAQGGSPDALKLMQEARQYIAKSHDIEDAIREGGGSIDARVLARKLQNGAPLSDELATIARFANNFKSAAQPAAQVQGPAVSALNAVGGSILGGAAGAMGDHPYVGGVMGPLALATVRGGARAQMLSKMSQNRLRDIYRLGAPTVATNRLLQYAPVAGAVFAREPLSQ